MLDSFDDALMQARARYKLAELTQDITAGPTRAERVKQAFNEYRAKHPEKAPEPEQEGPPREQPSPLMAQVARWRDALERARRGQQTGHGNHKLPPHITHS